MSKLKVAVLEDSPLVLRDMRDMLRETNLVDVVVCSQSCEDFIQKVKQANVDALILDIDIAGDSMSGIDVAYHLKLPVLFASGYNDRNIVKLEDLNSESWSIVEHITKTVTQDKLLKILPKFIERIRAMKKKQTVHIKVRGGSGLLSVNLDSVVYFCSCEGSEGRSQNKDIFFIDRRPEVLVDMGFYKLEELGFVRDKFIEPHRSYRVNVDFQPKYDKESHQLILTVMGASGRMETAKIPVSDNNQMKMHSRFR